MVEPDGIPRVVPPVTFAVMVTLRAPAADSCAPAGAIFEPRNLAGAIVQTGRCEGFLHFIEAVDHPQLPLMDGASGVLWMAAGLRRDQRGDCMAVVMQDYPEAAH